MLTSVYSCRDNRSGVYFPQLRAVQIDTHSFGLLEELRVNNLLSYGLTCTLCHLKLQVLFGQTCALAMSVYISRSSTHEHLVYCRAAYFLWSLLQD